MSGRKNVLIPLSAEGLTPVITIDGPSGSGKGTISRRIAAQLAFHFLDSGSLYRAVALASINRRLAVDDIAALAAIAATVPVQFETGEGGDARVLLAGQDVSRDLRREEVGDRASRVAVHAVVRNALLERQRRWRQRPGLVADGRDMGTVVFTDANLKIFLTASAEIRAQRRYKQLIEKGISANIEGLLEDIRERDRRDTDRAVAALKPAPDAVTIDSSALTIDQVVTKVLDLSKLRL